jgi:hypothetical protein
MQDCCDLDLAAIGDLDHRGLLVHFPLVSFVIPVGISFTLSLKST